MATAWYSIGQSSQSLSELLRLFEQDFPTHPTPFMLLQSDNVTVARLLQFQDFTFWNDDCATLCFPISEFNFPRTIESRFTGVSGQCL